LQNFNGYKWAELNFKLTTATTSWDIVGQPITSKFWMDRNFGASQVPIISTYANVF
jgi:hypothetical protein